MPFASMSKVTWSAAMPPGAGAMPDSLGRCRAACCHVGESHATLVDLMSTEGCPSPRWRRSPGLGRDRGVAVDELVMTPPSWP